MRKLLPARLKKTYSRSGKKNIVRDNLDAADIFKAEICFEHLLIKRLLEWQKQQYKSENISNGIAHKSDKAPWRTNEVRRYLKYQNATNFLIDEKVLELVAREDSQGYVALVNPFRDEYEVVALIGNWSKRQEEIWLHKWMNLGKRSIHDGKLLKHVYDQTFGIPRVADWTNPELVSPIPQKLGFKWVSIAPLIYGPHFIGMLLLTYSSGEEAASEEKMERLVKLAQLVLVPVLLPSARSMEESSLIKAFSAFFEPSIDRIEGQLQVRQRELKQIADSQPLSEPSCQAVKNKLAGILRDMEHITGSSRNLLKALNPVKPKEGCSHVSPSTMKETVERLVKGIVNDYEGQYSYFNPAWVKCEDKSLITVPLPVEHLKSILYELLLNSIRAVVELLKSLSRAINSPPDETGFSVRVRRQYELIRGAGPRIRIQSRKRNNQRDGQSIELTVGDNGIGMDEYVRDRAMELGFSTRVGGTGFGLTIVRLNTEICNGRVYLTTSEEKDEDRVVVTLKFGKEQL